MFYISMFPLVPKKNEKKPLDFLARSRVVGGQVQTEEIEDNQYTDPEKGTFQSSLLSLCQILVY